MRWTTIKAGAAALALSLGALSLGVDEARADYVKITDRSEFMSLVSQGELRRMGIALTVTPSGEIKGSAFGQPVAGDWSWEGHYFCRDLSWGDTDFGYNCQEVARSGNALRFTSDRGTGRSAELYLR